MSSEIHLPAETRTEFGKGAARRLRRADKVPAVVYGHGEAPLHLSLPGHQTMLALKHRNAVVTLDVSGDAHLALAKFVQRDPIKGFIEHVDFVTVRRGEKVQVDISVVTTGDPLGGTVVVVDHQTITVLADALNLPENVHVDVEGKAAGYHVLAKDLDLPAGVELVTDGEENVVSVNETHLEEELAEAEAEVGAGAAGTEDEAAEAETPAGGEAADAADADGQEAEQA
ncbi:50S ribosomal protein L25/general stress protein Ctc [Aquipuribacter sp. SD81]|uniref:50S ribosomal protein L25/general stress protein Ctc n=1 Tax=Aquipuribacter sp. SD81 TaxID=3127703 RepID=UPI00301A1870